MYSTHARACVCAKRHSPEPLIKSPQKIAAHVSRENLFAKNHSTVRAESAGMRVFHVYGGCRALGRSSVGTSSSGDAHGRQCIGATA